MSNKKKLRTILGTVGGFVSAGLLFWLACFLFGWDIVAMITSPKVIWIIAVMVVAGFAVYMSLTAPKAKV